MQNDTKIHQPHLASNRRYTIDEAFSYCAALTQSHYENFPVASLLLPAEKRPYLQAIYAFARAADDFADEGIHPAKDRLRLLENWEKQLDECALPSAAAASETPHNPVFVALGETIRRLGLTTEPFRDLITAFKMDVVKNRFASYDELLHYCRHSANPVGQLVLMIFGYRDKNLFEMSDNICTALQLTNLLQDISVDLKKNRIYIPQSDFATFGYYEEELQAGVADQRFGELVQFQIERTKELFTRGSELTTAVDHDLRLELKLVWFGGMSILRKCERAGRKLLHTRPHLGNRNKFTIFLRALFIKNLKNYKPWTFKDQWDPR